MVTRALDKIILFILEIENPYFDQAVPQAQGGTQCASGERLPARFFVDMTPKFGNTSLFFVWYAKLSIPSGQRVSRNPSVLPIHGPGIEWQAGLEHKWKRKQTTIAF